ncbi:MAG: DegT/DnrJ/EryC1/StrS family aminotransferase [Eubacteriales bacterium SKADARSKE-1]|nr:DegT/DnrJ/EryC1/StrS family aminotransferase [Eubacteriales bacterium SKADARSKE-1]
MDTIKFSPPDITQAEIDEVVDTLKSGWITTGPKTKLFEKEIASYCGTNMAVCLNSATACMELILRVLGVGPGDEVITSAYTYTASASVICHTGATPVLVDTAKDSFFMDYDKLEKAITNKTKVIIPVDLFGIMCDYDRILGIVNKKKNLFVPNNDIQKQFGRIIVMADSAHAFGASVGDAKCGSVADFSSFSFHAVKNLTTAEGGALTWKSIPGVSDEDLYNEFMLLSLHGQTKDALSKTQAGSWEYDIKILGYKCNMTDIMAAIGLAQLKRYDRLLSHRREIIEKYSKELEGEPVSVLTHYEGNKISSGHLFPVRLNGKDESFRNELIKLMAQKGISTNVHYKPLPLLTAYKNLEFNIKDFENAFNMYKNEITLPLHTLLSDDQVDYIINTFKKFLSDLK